jgi:hypothetical protein
MSERRWQNAYEAGQDRAAHGPTTENCHPRFFASDEALHEWIKGYYETKGLTIILKPLDRGRP